MPSLKNSRSKSALQISLVVSLFSLLAKAGGFYVTESTTALSDALESVIHILAVAFVYYGFLLSSKPADDKHLYGHERVEFLSVGIEGAVIIIAGFIVIYESINHYLYGHILQNLDAGILLMAAAGGVNYFLGSYLIKVGRRENNMMVVSNGKHTLTDVWTSASVVATLVIIRFTDWVILDSFVGFLLALYIMYEGFKLLKYSIEGLMDTKDPEVDRAIRSILDDELPGSMNSYHHLRHRTTGNTTWIEFHALFETDVDLKHAHEDATRLERTLIDAITGDVIVTIHLEPEGSHEQVHEELKNADQDRPMEDYI